MEKRGIRRVLFGLCLSAALLFGMSAVVSAETGGIFAYESGKKLASASLKQTKASATSITVTWGKVTGADYYRVGYVRSDKGSEDVKIKDVTGNSCTIKGLSNNTEYYVAVGAIVGG